MAVVDDIDAIMAPADGDGGNDDNGDDTAAATRNSASKRTSVNFNKRLSKSCQQS